jgi:glyoxylase-like metal-dependent hydrolase (beta-lactamase superfamily II)
MPTLVAPFRRLAWLRISNVFLLDGGRGDRWLIDCGHVLERPTLLAELRRAGLGPSDLTGVLLTHRHSDHAGNARFLQRHGVRIYAHRADAEVLAGRAPRPALPTTGRDAMADVFSRIENLFPARVVVDGALEAGDTIAGLEVHAAPGHTEGSVLFRHAPTRVLLTGDALLTAIPPLTLRAGLNTPYPLYSMDLPRAHEALRAFHRTGLPYEHLLAGHGPPLVGDARARVLEALVLVRPD